MARILLLGGDRNRVSGIRSILRQDGHQIVGLRSVDRWTAREPEIQPELVVAAVDCPEEVLDACRSRAGRFAAPLLFVQHDSDPYQDPHLDSRLVDQLTGPFLGEELLARVDALVGVRRIIHKQPVDDRRGSSAGGPISRLAGMLGLGWHTGSAERPVEPYLEVANRLAQWADQRDTFEPGHAERVTELCALMSEALRLDEDDTQSLLRAAALHDIGKIALPVEMLHQKTPLEEGQRKMIRTHPRRGAALLRLLDDDDDVAKTILYHHEQPNGEGYYGLDAKQIPRTARILAVAEVYDAMTRCRLTDPLPSHEALDRLRSGSGEIHDEDCVAALSDRLKPRRPTISLVPPPLR